MFPEPEPSAVTEHFPKEDQSSNEGHLSPKFKDLTYSFLLKEFQSKQVYVLSGHVIKVNYRRNHNYCLY